VSTMLWFSSPVAPAARVEAGRNRASDQVDGAPQPADGAGAASTIGRFPTCISRR
jgi:hypothetical protein